MGKKLVAITVDKCGFFRQEIKSCMNPKTTLCKLVKKPKEYRMKTDEINLFERRCYT